MELKESIREETHEGMEKVVIRLKKDSKLVGTKEESEDRNKLVDRLINTNG